jgi:class 3 adenylate cyclase
MRHKSASAEGHAAVDRASSFPDENPNPVLRVRQDGMLTYANRASASLLKTLDTAVDRRVPADFLELLSGDAGGAASFDLQSGAHTFAILAVPVPGLDVWNVYGTDVTGAKVVEKFPDRNPNPVLRLSPDGALIYANRASAPITRALGVAPGDLVAADLLHQLRARLDGSEVEEILLGGEGRIFRLDPVEVPEFRFINVYGTDVTAIQAMTAFPDENPNPVLRLDRDGVVVYANPASEPVRAAFGISTGERVPAELLERLQGVAQGPAPNTLEVESGDRIYELRVVTLAAFESINLYGSDVTAERERLRLLLNILPASIAQRLQGGETLIADRFEEMAVLFADVVDFTPFSAGRPPAEVVRVLNKVFTMFDRLAERHRLEKIKTIGDAYMVAGGLVSGGGSVEAVADMALDMLHELAHFRTDAGERLQVRIGLHAGPAVAGVIGVKKFIYDIWGDTVNTASRLESHGAPGRIQVTTHTAERLAHRYRFEARGMVELKGKGSVECHFLVGRLGGV